MFYDHMCRYDDVIVMTWKPGSVGLEYAGK